MPYESDRQPLMIKQCLECGTDIEIMFKRDVERKRMCSRSCRLKNLHRTRRMPALESGEKARAWKGGRYHSQQGYVKVYTGPNQYGLEHRIVMEQILGRPLAEREQVHHKNGVRDDNRPENLELWVGNQPTGIRAADRHCPTCTCGGESDPVPE